MLAPGVLSGGVADGRGQEFEVPVVQAGDGVTQRDGKVFGDTGGELEDALFPAAEGDLPVMEGAERGVPVIEDAKQIFGAGQARNRVAGAVRRTLPFTLICQTLAAIWYTTAGRHPDDLTARRRSAPWYTTKTEPSTADMIAKLRRVLIAARFQQPRPDQPTPAEIHVMRLACLGDQRGVITKVECQLGH